MREEKQNTNAQARCSPIDAHTPDDGIVPNEAPERKRRSASRRLRKRKRRIRLAILWTVFLLAAAVLIFCIVAIIFTMIERKAARDQYAQMQAAYELSAPKADDAAAETLPLETPDPAKWYAGYAKVADKQIDFSALTQRNADVCAWISIDGTTIDYPVLQATGKDVLYLNHDIDGKPSEHGTICLDVQCARDFSDRVTLIYGHNMKDDSMFAPLYRYYRDVNFFHAEHRVKIYLDNVVLTYRVIAAYEYGYEHPLYYYRMENDADFMAYCDTFLENRDLKAHITPSTITPEDHILTLITSTNVRADKRLFVQAVLEHGE